jgi:two-component system response regulator YesN
VFAGNKPTYPPGIFFSLQEGRKMTALIVDDESITRKGIISNIKWSEFGINRIIEAGDGQEALSAASQNKIDIIITDIRMPNLNGLDLIDKMYKEYGCQIIIISAYAEKEYLKSAIKFHVISYIEKPINLTDLQNAIREASVAVINNKRNLSTIRLGETDHEHLKKKNDLFWHPAVHVFPGHEVNVNDFVIELINGIIKNDPSVFDKTLDDIEAKIRQDNLVDAETAKMLFVKLGTVLIDYSRLINSKESEDRYINPKNINYLETVLDCNSFIKRLYHSLDELICTVAEKKLIAAKVDLLIEYHYQSHNLYIPYICNILSMSKSKLCKTYKDETGMTINERIIQCRIEKACELLRKKSTLISEVSAKTGFTDQNYFTRIFKQMFGVTPTLYQERIE